MFWSSSPDSLQTNFLVGQDEQRSRKQTIVMAVLFACGVGCFAALGAYASYRLASTQTTGFPSAWQLLQGLPGMNQFIGPDPHATDGTQTATKDRLNILLLGVGGDGHDGAQLSDTIIVASIDTKNKKVAMLSIPRDLAYPLGEGRFEKINAVQAYFERDYPGEGATRTAQAFATLLEMPIDHVVRIDFSGFADFINALGGIDVKVENSFTDSQFPTDESGPNPYHWTTATFTKGVEHMDGRRALTFARSRHGNNGEGSDFARSRRQQIVILAVREKLLRLDTVGDPRKLAALYSAIANHLQSDLTPWEAMKLAPLFKDFSTKDLTMHVLDDAPGHELVSANVNGAFMLFPRKPDWSEIREIAQNPFQTTSTASVPNPDPIVLKSKIEVRNGTLRTGFASQIAAMLERNSFEVRSFGNAIRRGYEETVIYDLTQGRKQEELHKLQRLLNASVSLSPPTRENTKDGLAPEKAQYADSDFLVVLGEASYPLLQSSSYATP